MSNFPPGAWVRSIPDPQAEVDRLAAERKSRTLGMAADGEHDEWAIRHPDGLVTVTASGPAFRDRAWAEGERAECDRWCGLCPGGSHVLVTRHVPAWENE